MPKKLKIFLCHSSDDKAPVREIYERLKSENWIDPWLDEEELYPGQDWGLEIEKAVEETDTVLVFLSDNSVTKKGYVQKELRLVLRISDYQPDGTIFTIPLRLEKCSVPRALSMWQYVDLFPETRQDWAYKRLLGGLKIRAKKLGIDVGEQRVDKERVESRQVASSKRQVASLQEKNEREIAEEERIEKRARELAVEFAQKEREERVKKRAEEANEKKLVEEKARKEKEANEKKLVEEKARKEKEANEKRLAEKKARQEKEARERELAEEKARKEEAKAKKLAENPANIEWIEIPAGEFTMGSNDYSSEKPPHKVYLDEYLMAKTPVTNAQFKKFIEAGGYKKKEYWSNKGWEWRSNKKRTQPYLWKDKKWSAPTQPVIGVSWYEAEAFSTWANCRLPSEAEWEKAARGPSTSSGTGRKYPWGNAKPNNKLANFNGNIGETTPVGKYSPAGDSPYGCVDMAGNIWE